VEVDGREDCCNIQQVRELLVRGRVPGGGLVQGQGGWIVTL
jgi:hypothetical protein